MDAATAPSSPTADAAAALDGEAVDDDDDEGEEEEEEEEDDDDDDEGAGLSSRSEAWVKAVEAPLRARDGWARVVLPPLKARAVVTCPPSPRVCMFLRARPA